MDDVKKKNKYEIDMCSGNLFKKIIVFCIPLMLMGILQLLYNTDDLLVVSLFSGDKNALGAVGSTSSLINLIVNLFKKTKPKAIKIVICIIGSLLFILLFFKKSLLKFLLFF